MQAVIFSSITRLHALPNRRKMDRLEVLHNMAVVPLMAAARTDPHLVPLMEAEVGSFKILRGIVVEKMKRENGMAQV